MSDRQECETVSEEPTWSVEIVINDDEQVAMDYAGPRIVGPGKYMVVRPSPFLGRSAEGWPSTLHLDLEAPTADEAQVRATSVAALRELGYNTFEAANGKDALSLIEKQPAIDLLFTDIVMPDMSGRQLADAVLAICPSIKVLYTTGYTRNAIVHNGIVDIGVALAWT